MKIKNLNSAKEMWQIVKNDATTKTTLHLIEAEDQLSSMRLSNNEGPKSHLTELKEHFQQMLQCRDNLTLMGSTLSNTHFNAIIMSSLSLPLLYQPTLQTITAAERTTLLLGVMSSQMKLDDLISFILEEAQHCVINEDWLKNTELALAAHSKKGKRNKPNCGKGSGKSKDDQSDVTCKNCNRPGHMKPKCWSKGGGKEGQGPRQRKSKKSEKTKSAVVAVDEEKDDEMFAPQIMPTLSRPSRFLSQSLVLVWTVAQAGTTAQTD